MSAGATKTFDRSHIPLKSYATGVYDTKLPYGICGGELVNNQSDNAITLFTSKTANIIDYKMFISFEGFITCLHITLEQITLTVFIVYIL